MSKLIKTIKILQRETVLDVQNDNVDVEVTLTDDNYYVITFYTLSNLKLLMQRWQKTGEYGGGKHFYAADSVIVESLEPKTIKQTVDYLVESGEILSFTHS